MCVPRMHRVERFAPEWTSRARPIGIGTIKIWITMMNEDITGAIKWDLRVRPDLSPDVLAIGWGTNRD